MNNNLPEIMLAVLLSEIDGQLTARHVPIPRPGPGEVLIKMAASPINPSDIKRIKSVTDPSDRLWFVPGIEGSGTVVAHGEGLFPRLWLGKRVACNSIHKTSGTWAQYMTTSASLCVPIPDSISDEQGAMMLVNPMTALAFFDMAKKNGHKAIINTAAASSLGKIMGLMGRKYRMPVIHIVRNIKQKKSLTDLGFKFVLDNSEKNFQDDLYSLSHTLKATLAFDAVGGTLTRQIMIAIPAESTLVIYGNLSGEPPETDHNSLVLNGKKIRGFFLGNYIKEKGMLNTLSTIYRVRRLFKTGLAIQVQNRFSLEMAQSALETYTHNMSAGKVLLIPG